MSENHKNSFRIDRRHFIRNLSISFAGAVTATGYPASNVFGKAVTGEAGKMKYRTLGRTGLKVSEVALGGHYTGMGWQEKGSKRQSLRNEVIGVIQVINHGDDEPFNEDNMYLLSSISMYASIAIEHANLYQELHERT